MIPRDIQFNLEGFGRIVYHPANVSLASGGTANLLLSVSTSGLTPRRAHTILVVATSETDSHSLD
jgi:hypothetical protein